MASLNGRASGNIGGALAHSGAAVGLFGVTPAARPAAIVQTYATAERTHAAPTASVLTSNGVSANTTLVDVTTAAVADPVKVNANFDDVADAVNKLIADVADVKQVVNAVVDDLQSLGIEQ